MSTTSPILHLTLPASDGSDQFDLDSQFLANWDIIDASPGILITLAADLPTLTDDQFGRFAYLTDDDDQYLVVWNGTGPGWTLPNVSANDLAVNGVVLATLNMDGHSVTAALNLTATGSVFTETLVVNGIHVTTFAGNPNGSVTSVSEGDLVVDHYTPGLWQATASSSDSAWVSVTAADIGSVGTELYNVVQDINYGMSFTAPDPTIYAGLVAHAPSSGTVFIPLTTLAPGDGIVANFGQDITTAGDANATWSVSCVLGVWDAAGTNYLQATGSLSAVDSSTGDQYLTLTQVTLVGSDLSIQANGGGGDNITTAAGGAYNVLLQTETVWF
jgi:hypothetical protein